MNILVCIKQVPGSQKTEMDEKTGTLIRSSTNTRMNPFDLVALEFALQLKDQYSAHITAITMGPAAARNVLIEALAMGVDNVVLVSGKEFAGADVLATSHSLYYAIKSLELKYDLVCCGLQSVDGDTAQLGPSLAQLLEYPHVTHVSDAKPNGYFLSFNVREVDRIIHGEIETPCLFVISKDALTPRLPSFLTYDKIRNKSIFQISSEDFKDLNFAQNIGSNGSPTQVKRIYVPIHNKTTLNLKDDHESIVSLINFLHENQIKGGLS